MNSPITVLIPVFNEEKGISDTVIELDKVIKTLPKGSELIYINDGSTDDTAKILKKLNSKYNFRLLNHVVNTGYGSALKTGTRLAENDLIMITDADCTYPNNRMLDFLKEMTPEVSMVVGARTTANAHIPAIRKPAKMFIRKLASFFAEREIPDINSGMRLMRKDLILQYVKLLPNGFSFTTTITLALLVNGYQVKYIPIDYYKREGRSKIKPIKDTLNFINLILTTVFAFQPNKFFTPLTLIALIGMIISIGYDLFERNNLTDLSVLSLILFLNILSLNVISSMISKK